MRRSACAGKSPSFRAYTFAPLPLSVAPANSAAPSAQNSFTCCGKVHSNRLLGPVQPGQPAIQSRYGPGRGVLGGAFCRNCRLDDAARVREHFPHRAAVVGAKLELVLAEAAAPDGLGMYEARLVTLHPAQQRLLLVLIERALLRAASLPMPLGPRSHRRFVYCAAVRLELLHRRQPYHPEILLRHEHAEPQTFQGGVADEAQASYIVLVVPAALGRATCLSPSDVDERLP